jgi:RNA polymerase sigma-70 factor (ECF subfamily)
MHDQDHAVIQRILGGEKKAYAELVERHKDRALTLAVRILKNREDAEEALQDAFIRAFNALPRFEWKSSFSTWFYRIVYNVCVSGLSRRDRKQRISIDDEDESGSVLELASEETPPDLALESSELNAIVQEEIDRLPGAYGPTFTLFFVQEMSYDEVVEVTGLPLGTVKARLFRARVMLRNALVRRLGTQREGQSQEKATPSPAADSSTSDERRTRRSGTHPY